MAAAQRPDDEEERLALLSRALEQSAELVVITDPDGRIEYVNPAFERVTGWRAAEVIGRTPAILKSGQHPPEVYGDLWARVTAGRTWTGQFHNRRKDGSLFLQLLPGGVATGNHRNPAS